MPPLQQTVQTFGRYRAIGGDAIKSFGLWKLRGEWTYVWTDNNDGRNPLTQPSHLNGVLGLENPLGGGFRLITQLSYTSTDSWKATAGLMYFGGPGYSPLGILSFFNSIYLEMKYSF